jgi:serine-type D-Ala-D-Ala carboxypeptidase/endopeptidase (penicillin-binding protein 4)
MHMKNILIFLLLSLSASLAYADLPAPIEEAFKKADIPLDSVSVFVQGVDESMPTITHNTNKAMNPASVMKLVTTYAALEALTPAYRWKTEVYRNGDVENGVLLGDLVIKGYGDPSFDAQAFWRLLMRLRQTGIGEIKGDLIIDKSYFARETGNGPPFDDETWRAYNALPSAFLVNGRHTSLRFNVQDNVVQVDQEFSLPQVEIVNHLRLSKAACGAWRQNFTYDIQPSSTRVKVVIDGTYAATCGERYLELSLLSDEQYAFFTFQKLWAELGGKFDGRLQVKEVPLTALEVLEQVSEPLGYVIHDVNKWSNNLMARQILLTLAAEKQSVPATELKGADVVRQTLAENGFNFKELVIENGSGLSRIERISAEHLGQMLVSAYHSPVMPELIASLPILAVDGTVQTRMRDSTLHGRSHLKTGSLDGVSAIAGYVLDHHSKRYVVVIMVNHKNAARSKEAQDAVLSWVHDSQTLIQCSH